jgi:hypothetical protein
MMHESTRLTGGFMGFPYVRWSVCGIWVSVVLLTFMFVDPSSVRSWLVLFVAIVVPPSLLLRLWSDGPPATVAEVLHATEERR